MAYTQIHAALCCPRAVLFHVVSPFAIAPLTSGSPPNGSLCCLLVTHEHDEAPPPIGCTWVHLSRSLLRVHPSLSAEGAQGTTRLSSLLAAGRVLREDLARRNERGFWLVPRGAPSKWS